MNYDANGMLTYTSMLTPIAVTATAGTIGVDVSGYVGKLVVRVKVGLGSGTSPTMAIKLQESDDDSTYTDITGATGSANATNAVALNENIAVNARGVKKYIRAFQTVGGTSPSFPVALDLIGFKQVES